MTASHRAGSVREAVALHVGGDRHALLVGEHVLPRRHLAKAVGRRAGRCPRASASWVELRRLARIGALAVALGALPWNSSCPSSMLAGSLRNSSVSSVSSACVIRDGRDRAEARSAASIARARLRNLRDNTSPPTTLVMAAPRWLAAVMRSTGRPEPPRKVPGKLRASRSSCPATARARSCRSCRARRSDRW